MSNSPFSSVLVGAISGAVAATLVTLVLSPASAGRGALARTPALAGPSPDLADAQEALSSLALENQALELRIASLEARPQVSSQRAPLQQKLAEGNGPQVAAGQTPLAPGRLIDARGAISEGYYEEFRMASELYAKEKEAELLETRRLEREQRNEDRLLRLSERLGLDTYQADRVRVILGTQDEQRTAAFEAMRGEGALDQSREEIRDSMRRIEEDANTAMQAVLTPIQYEEYQTTSRRGLGPGAGGIRGLGGNRPVLEGRGGGRQDG